MMSQFDTSLFNFGILHRGRFPPDEETQLLRRAMEDAVLTAVKALSLRPGHSFLAIDAHTGLANHLAGHLIGPGCRNVGLTSTPLLERCRFLTRVVRRCNPQWETRASLPVFTDRDEEAVNAEWPRYDRILVLASQPDDTAISRLMQLLSPGGRMVARMPDNDLKRFKMKDGEELEKTVYEFSETSLLFWQLGGFSYRHSFSPLSPPPPRQPASLALLALRSKVRAADPLEEWRDALPPFILKTNFTKAKASSAPSSSCASGWPPTLSRRTTAKRSRLSLPSWATPCRRRKAGPPLLWPPTCDTPCRERSAV